MITLLNLNLPKRTRSIAQLEYLNAEGANKLLKILRSPNQTYFLLIAKDESKIMPTLPLDANYKTS